MKHELTAWLFIAHHDILLLLTRVLLQVTFTRVSGAVTPAHEVVLVEHRTAHLAYTFGNTVKFLQTRRVRMTGSCVTRI